MDVTNLLLAGMTATLGFLLKRELSRKDALEKAVADLATAVTELRLMLVEKFLPRVEHHSDIDAIRASIKEWTEKFEEGFEKCQQRHKVA